MRTADGNRKVGLAKLQLLQQADYQDKQKVDLGRKGLSLAIVAMKWASAGGSVCPADFNGLPKKRKYDGVKRKGEKGYFFRKQKESRDYDNNRRQKRRDDKNGFWLGVWMA